MERIDRRGDELRYQPRLHVDRIHELYVMKEETGQPMTVILDRVVKETYTEYKQAKPVKGNYVPE